MARCVKCVRCSPSSHGANAQHCTDVQLEVQAHCHLLLTRPNMPYTPLSASVLIKPQPANISNCGKLRASCDYSDSGAPGHILCNNLTMVRTVSLLHKSDKTVLEVILRMQQFKGGYAGCTIMLYRPDHIHGSEGTGNYNSVTSDGLCMLL